MVGATAIASLGTFLPLDRVAQVFKNGTIPTASISFFPAGRAVRKGKGYRVNGRWAFNSGIRHAEWVLGGTVVEGTELENGGKPIVMFSAFPAADVTLHDNWGGVVGLRGTGSCDFSVENVKLPPDLTFVWDSASWVRAELVSYYSPLGRPSIDPALDHPDAIVGYVFAIRSERLLCREVQVNLAYRWFCGLSIEGSFGFLAGPQRTLPYSSAILPPRLRGGVVEAKGCKSTSCSFGKTWLRLKGARLVEPDRRCAEVKGPATFCFRHHAGGHAEPSCSPRDQDGRVKRARQSVL